jgi:hypothetical protein
MNDLSGPSRQYVQQLRGLRRRVRVLGIEVGHDVLSYNLQCL